MADAVPRETMRALAERAARGEIGAARAAAEALLTANPASAALVRFLGLLDCQENAFGEGVERLEEALRLALPAR